MALQMHVSTKKYIIKGGGLSFQIFPNPYTICGHRFPLPFKTYLLSNYWKTYNVSIYFLKLPVALSLMSLRKLLKHYILIFLKMENP